MNKYLATALLSAVLVLGGAACSKVSQETDGGTDTLGTDDLTDLFGDTAINGNANGAVSDSESGANTDRTGNEANGSATDDDRNTNESGDDARNENANAPDDDRATNVNGTDGGNVAEDVRAEVTVTAAGFSPSSVTIPAGGSVRWKNEAGRTVYVAPDDHPSHTRYTGAWDDSGDGQIGNDASYTQTFSRAGTYRYHNHLNSGQTGTVIVE